MNSSTSQHLREIVSEETSISQKTETLNTQVFPNIVEEFNHGDAADRLTRLTQDVEPVPNHSRNVTEVRSRVGLLLEFNLGIVIEEYLPDEHVVSYGASQAHTDLVLRGPDRKPTIRLEVKAIEDIAEEKAASYEDMVHSIDPQNDVLAIFTWGWKVDHTNGTETRIPQLYDLRAFEMKEISMARDLLWMQDSNRGNKNMMDISMPVIQKGSEELKEEEGNMGKLTRIVDQDDLENNPELKSQLKFDELQRYIQYMSFCKGIGITRASELYLKKYDYSYSRRDEHFHYKPNKCQFVNYGESKSRPNLLIFSGSGSITYSGDLTNPIEKAIYKQMNNKGFNHADVLIIDNEKFKWTYAEAHAEKFGGVESISTGVKKRGDNLFGDKIGRTPI